VSAFSSLDKYDSHTGWPVLPNPCAHNIVVREDKSLLMSRTEVIPNMGNRIWGMCLMMVLLPRTNVLHEFRCVRIYSSQDLKKRGYGKYLPLFEKTSKQSAGSK